MSYELTFLPKAPDQSWDQAVDAAERVPPGGAPDPAAWARILDAARQILGDVTTDQGDDCFELTDRATRIQVHLYAEEAGILIPYWYTGLSAATLVDLAFRLGRAIEAATGYVGYDEQAEVYIDEPGAERAVGEFDTLGAMVIRGTVLRSRGPAG